MDTLRHRTIPVFEQVKIWWSKEPNVLVPFFWWRRTPFKVKADIFQSLHPVCGKLKISWFFPTLDVIVCSSNGATPICQFFIFWHWIRNTAVSKLIFVCHEIATTFVEWLPVATSTRNNNTAARQHLLLLLLVFDAAVVAVLVAVVVVLVAVAVSVAVPAVPVIGIASALGFLVLLDLLLLVVFVAPVVVCCSWHCVGLLQAAVATSSTRFRVPPANMHKGWHYSTGTGLYQIPVLSLWKLQIALENECVRNQYTMSFSLQLCFFYLDSS